MLGAIRLSSGGRWTEVDGGCGGNWVWKVTWWCWNGVRRWETISPSLLAGRTKSRGISGRTEVEGDYAKR